jgi:hypothetical protein
MPQRKKFPVTTETIHPEIRALIKQYGADRVRVLNSRECIIYNSKEAKERLSRKRVRKS